MSKTLARSRSSPPVSRSKSSVAKPVSLSASATCRLRGLSRLEPLPWAKTTRPAAGSGRRRSPATRTPGAGSISTERSSGACHRCIASSLAHECRRSLSLSSPLGMVPQIAMPIAFGLPAERDQAA